MGQKELNMEYHDVNASSRHYEYNNNEVRKSNNNEERESISWRKFMIWYKIQDIDYRRSGY